MPTLQVASATLLCHPATPCTAVLGISATVTLLAEGGLSLAYRLHGRLAELRIAPPMLPTATRCAVDGLWQHSCFEAFIANSQQTAYQEINLAPSGQWASYAFSDYRQRQPLDPAPAPWITVSQQGDALTLHALIEAPFLSFLPDSAQRLLGLSAVIESADGSLSYWALAHPPGQPDFHHRSAFKPL